VIFACKMKEIMVGVAER